jgi:hypothetical protein
MYDAVVVRCLMCECIVRRGYAGDAFELHAQHTCPIECPCCSMPTNRADIAAHLQVCPNLNIPCAAHDIGCAFHDFRINMPEHERRCQLILIAPKIRAQANAIQELTVQCERQAQMIGALQIEIETLQVKPA